MTDALTRCERLVTEVDHHPQPAGTRPSRAPGNACVPSDCFTVLLVYCFTGIMSRRLTSKIPLDNGVLTGSDIRKQQRCTQPRCIILPSYQLTGKTVSCVYRTLYLLMSKSKASRTNSDLSHRRP